MTVSYVSQIATSKFWKFFRLLILWKGSIYKMVWFELLLFGVLYSAISIMYRWILTGVYKIQFEQFCLYCDSVANFMPIAFILGFYVTMIANRWSDQFNTIPWPDHVALFVNTYIPDNSEKVVVLKRNIVRYLNVSLLLYLRSVSPQTKRRFPTEESLVESRLLSETEFNLFNQIDSRYNRYYVPIAWASNMVKRAYLDGVIQTEGRMNNIILEIAQFRERLNKLFSYDWVNTPLVYTQTATIAVYTYFVTSLFSRQFLDPSKNYKNHNIDFYVPVFFLIQLTFYFGWLKVAECLINPFGEDDDDFDCLGLIERNLGANAIFLKSPLESLPVLMKDVFWDNEFPVKLEDYKEDKNFFVGSMVRLDRSI